MMFRSRVLRQGLERHPDEAGADGVFGGWLPLFLRNPHRLKDHSPCETGIAESPPGRPNNLNLFIPFLLCPFATKARSHKETRRKLSLKYAFVKVGGLRRQGDF